MNKCWPLERSYLTFLSAEIWILLLKQPQGWPIMVSLASSLSSFSSPPLTSSFSLIYLLSLSASLPLRLSFSPFVFLWHSLYLFFSFSELKRINSFFSWNVLLSSLVLDLVWPNILLEDDLSITEVYRRHSYEIGPVSRFWLNIL